MPTDSVPVWNTLEVVKLIVGVLTPLSVVVFGWWISRRLKSFEHLQWANQKVVEKRLRVYEEVVPVLNDLLCYFTYVGAWKSVKPETIVGLKRELDRVAYVNSPLLPPDFLSRYNNFIHLCYQTYSGWGEDAKLRMKFERRQDAFPDTWLDEWATCFDEWATCFVDEDECSDPQEVRAAYGELVAYFASELGVGVQLETVATGRLPGNIR